jgi:hypothetical protein
VLRDNKVVFHEPAAIDFEKSATCADFRDMLKKRSRDELLDICRTRMSEKACQACLSAR